MELLIGAQTGQRCAQLYEMTQIEFFLARILHITEPQINKLILFHWLDEVYLTRLISGIQSIIRIANYCAKGVGSIQPHSKKECNQCHHHLKQNFSNP